MSKRLLVNMGIVALLALTFGACGGDDGDGGGGGGSPTAPGGDDGPVAATITIDASGAVSPRDVTVPVGSRVTFVNNHTANHEMASDPHPTHTLCTALNTVGFLAPGQSRTSSNLTVARNCSYHDHINDTNTNLQGLVRVQ